jgi:hypothetical protein
MAQKGEKSKAQKKVDHKRQRPEKKAKIIGLVSSKPTEWIELFLNYHDMGSLHFCATLDC